ncbi:MAG: hypothetical protein Q8N81_02045 [bacterium]|nr:hypothetical protein [bacterium]
MNSRSRQNYQQRQERMIKDLKAGRLVPAKAAIRANYLKDYAKDKRRCLTTVAFVPDTLAERITKKVIAPLKSIEPDFHFYSKESLHTTIEGIRTVSDPPLFTPQEVNSASDLFSRLVPTLPAFSFRFKGLIAFPANSPTSISLTGYCDERLRTVVRALDKGLERIGVSYNDSYHYSKDVFFGTIAVCRFTHKPREAFIKKVNDLGRIDLGEMLVDRLNLIVCNLVCDLKSREIIASYNLKT